MDPDRENDFVGGLVLPNFFFYFTPKNHHFDSGGLKFINFWKAFKVGKFSIVRKLFVKGT